MSPVVELTSSRIVGSTLIWVVSSFFFSVKLRNYPRSICEILSIKSNWWTLHESLLKAVDGP